MSPDKQHPDTADEPECRRAHRFRHCVLVPLRFRGANVPAHLHVVQEDGRSGKVHSKLCPLQQI